jgi:multidrug efflux system membrane fusion protein
MTLAAPPVQGAGFRPVIVVEAAYPGANAQIVADTVAAPVEQQINGVERLKRMVSRCTDDGRYVLMLSFDTATDLDATQLVVQNRVSLAVPLLPAAVVNSGVAVRKLSTGPCLVVVLTSPDASRDTRYLGGYASLQIRDELARVGGVGDVSVLGGENHELRIIVDGDKLAALNLTTDDVLKALRQQNLQEKVGSGAPSAAKTADQLELRLDVSGRAAEPEALSRIVVKTASGGGLILLRDVAKVEAGSGSSNGGARFDGRPAVALVITLASSAKPSEVSTAVRERMEKLKSSFPPGLDYNVALDLVPPARSGPAAPYRCLLAEPMLPAGASADRWAECRNQYADIIRQTEGVRRVLSLPENPFGRFRGGSCVVAIFDAGPKEADWQRAKQAIRARLTQDVRSATPRLCDLAGPAGVWPVGYPIEFALRGPDAQSVREFGIALSARLAQTGQLSDMVDGPKTAPGLDVEVDRKKAAVLGVSLADIGETIRIALGSAEIEQGDSTGRSVRVRLQIEAGQRDAAGELKRLKVRGAEGQMVPLSSIVALRDVDAPTSVDRVDLRPAATISGNPTTGVSLAEARWLCETLAEQVRKELRLPAEYELVWLQELPPPRPMPGDLKRGAEPPPPEVKVARPVAREVTDYEDFVGRIDAIQSVELRARVTGYLVKTLATEGGEVKKGDVLFEIDPRPYQAQLDQARAEMDLAKARLKLAEAARARLEAANAGKPALDEAGVAVDKAKARLTASGAALARHQLDLDYCRVRAPIDGVVGRNHYTVGNLVTQDTTSLSTIVSQGPMYVYFDMDERSYLNVRRMIHDGKIKARNASEAPVAVGLANEDGFPHHGKLDFVDNRVDPASGALKMRAILPDTGRVLRPGMFARVRVAMSEPRKALLVPEDAIGSDRGQKVVYVIDAENKVASRVVTIGARHDGLREVATGLRPDERVITKAHASLRPGQTVKPIAGPP